MIKRVNKQRCCPICGKSDWCGVAEDGSFAICMRVMSDYQTENEGWLHRLGEDQAQRWREFVITPKPKPNINWHWLSLWCIKHCPEEKLQEFADELGVTQTSLRALRVGWHPKKKCWTFPMGKPVSPAGSYELCGMQLRPPNGGRKFMVTHSESALFMAYMEESVEGWLCVTEGPTDTAAIHGLGFSVLGRAGSKSATKHIERYFEMRPCYGREPSKVCIIADADKAGREGADQLYEAIRRKVDRVSVIEPVGAKDAREWVRNGLTTDRLLRAIESRKVAA
ncbi:MAG: toprim domain-containing protein [Planctomycetota bacterium]